MAEKRSDSTADREIVITRVVKAARELVWKVWTDPEHVAKWWGPIGFTTTIKKMDVRVGGVWKHTMCGPDGTIYPNSSVFRVVEKPERIEFAHGGARAGGAGVSFYSTWLFEVVSEKETRVTIHMVFDTPAERDRVVKDFGAIEGGQQTLGRLDDYVATLQE